MLLNRRSFRFARDRDRINAVNLWRVCPCRWPMPGEVLDQGATAHCPVDQSLVLIPLSLPLSPSLSLSLRSSS